MFNKLDVIYLDVPRQPYIASELRCMDRALMYGHNPYIRAPSDVQTCIPTYGYVYTILFLNLVLVVEHLLRQMLKGPMLIFLVLHLRVSKAQKGGEKHVLIKVLTKNV